MQASYLLSEMACRHGYRVEAHESVTSTNILAADHAKQGDKGLLWVVAQEQTQGVGRRGRQWHSPPGNLYASLLLIADYPPDEAAQLGFVAGVSLVEGLKKLTDSASDIQLKWPNDLLLEGKKLTGILVERHQLPQVEAAIIIGIGINIVSNPPAANYPTTNLRASGFQVTPPQVFMALSAAWAMNFDRYNQKRDFGYIREKWLSHAAGLGRDIDVVCQGQRVRGCFKTIDAQGQLVIETDKGNQVMISAGDVHFGDAATWKSE